MARVRLESLAPRHFQDFSAARRQSAAFLRPWEPAPPPDTDPYSRELFDEALERSKATASTRFVIVRKSDERLLGGMSVNNIVRGAFQSASVGYWIAEPFARQGYTTEALQLALWHCFEELDLHRVEANVMPHNQASLSLIARAGFRREGFSRRFLRINGEWRDHERWALLVEDYSPLDF